MFTLQVIPDSPLNSPSVDARKFYKELYDTDDCKNFNRFLKKITSNFIDEIDFSSTLRRSNLGRPYAQVYITIECAKNLALMADTVRGKMYRTHLIRLEKDTTDLRGLISKYVADEISSLGLRKTRVKAIEDDREAMTLIRLIGKHNLSVTSHYVNTMACLDGILVKENGALRFTDNRFGRDGYCTTSPKWYVDTFSEVIKRLSLK